VALSLTNHYPPVNGCKAREFNHPNAYGIKMPDNQTIGVLLPFVEGDYFNLLPIGVLLSDMVDNSLLSF
jgi:hypothetical protein